MNMTRFRELLRRDGWLYAAIALCVVLALSVSAISGSSPDEETRIAVSYTHLTLPTTPYV